jgi:hypothetical protein
MADLVREASVGVAAVDHYVEGLRRALAGGRLGAPQNASTKIDTTLDGARSWEVSFVAGGTEIMSDVPWDVGETAAGPPGATDVTIDFPSFGLVQFNEFAPYGAPPRVARPPCCLAGPTPQLVQAYTARRVAAALEEAGFAASIERMDATRPGPDGRSAGGRLVVVVDGTEADLRGPEWETGVLCVVGRVAGALAVAALDHLREFARTDNSWHSDHSAGLLGTPDASGEGAGAGPSPRCFAAPPVPGSGLRSDACGGLDGGRGLARGGARTAAR